MEKQIDFIKVLEIQHITWDKLTKAIDAGVLKPSGVDEDGLPLFDTAQINDLVKNITASDVLSGVEVSKVVEKAMKKKVDRLSAESSAAASLLKEVKTSGKIEIEPKPIVSAGVAHPPEPPVDVVSPDDPAAKARIEIKPEDLGI